MTDLGPPLFFWVMLGVTAACFAAAIAAAVRRRIAMAVICASLGLLIGLVMWYFAITGRFCVAPPGSACA